jgi:hypothetical protein
VRYCGQALAVAAVCCGTLVASIAPAISADPLARQLVEEAPPELFDVFLDRLMIAESSGRSAAKNPRSTALGPFQFIRSTFLDITRRHFSLETAGLSEAEILSLRSDRDLSRRAATVFCRENAKYLQDRGHEPTFAHLRLAFLLGAADAAQVLHAKQQTPLTDLLSPLVVKANPFMRAMSVADLLQKSERDVSEDRPFVTAVAPNQRPVARVRPSLGRRVGGVGGGERCGARRASCRQVMAVKTPIKGPKG